MTSRMYKVYKGGGLYAFKVRTPLINGDNEGVIESTDKFLVKHKLLEVHYFYEGLRNRFPSQRSLLKLQLLTLEYVMTEVFCKLQLV